MIKSVNWKRSVAISFSVAFLIVVSFMLTTQAKVVVDCDTKNDPAKNTLEKVKGFFIDEVEVADGVCVWRWLDHPAR